LEFLPVNAAMDHVKSSRDRRASRARPGVPVRRIRFIDAFRNQPAPTNPIPQSAASHRPSTKRRLKPEWAFGHVPSGPPLVWSRQFRRQNRGPEVAAMMAVDNLDALAPDELCGLLMKRSFNGPSAGDLERHAKRADHVGDFARPSGPAIQTCWPSCAPRRQLEALSSCRRP